MKRNLSNSECPENKKINVTATPEKDRAMATMEEDNEQQVSVPEDDKQAVSEGPEPTLREVLASLTQLHVKFDSHVNDLRTLQTTTVVLDEKLNNLEDIVQSQTSNMNIISNENQDLRQEIDFLKTVIIKQQDGLKTIQNQTTELIMRSMRDNLLLHNVPETQPHARPESCVDIIRREFLKAGLMPEGGLHIERAHRLGQYNSKTPRPIVMKIQSKEGEEILKKAQSLQKGPETIRVTRQLPQELRAKRQQMWEVADRYKLEDRNCKTKVTADGKLLVNGQIHREPIQAPDVRELILLSPDQRQELVAASKLVEGKVITERGSSFAAAVATVSSVEEVRKAYKSFVLSGRLSSRHNLATYRIYNPTSAKTVEGWEDDGEHGGGRTLRNYLQKRNLTNIAVFLSRGSEGTHLGNRRYQLMEEAVESALCMMKE